MTTEKEEFCYAFEEKRKCVPDPGRKLKEVVETKTMRLFVDTDHIWVERFLKTKSTTK